jgi:hypothetical protein
VQFEGTDKEKGEELKDKKNNQRKMKQVWIISLNALTMVFGLKFIVICVFIQLISNAARTQVAVDRPGLTMPWSFYKLTMVSCYLLPKLKMDIYEPHTFFNIVNSWRYQSMMQIVLLLIRICTRSICQKYFPILTFLTIHNRMAHPATRGLPKKGVGQNSMLLDDFLFYLHNNQNTLFHLMKFILI